MDVLGFIDLPGWVLTIIIILITLYLYSLWYHSLWRRLGIPGPRPIPFLGILPSYKQGLAKTDLELVNTYGSVVGIYHGHLPVLLVSDPEMVKEIFIKEFSNYTNKPVPFKMDEHSAFSVGTAKDNHWKFLRSTISPTFSSGKLKLMVPKIERCCTNLVENIKQQSKQGEQVDMKGVCETFTMDVIASTAFGIDVNSQNEPNNQFVKHAKAAALGEIFGPKFFLIMMFPILKHLFTIHFMKKEAVDFFRSVVESAIGLRKKGQKVYNDFLQLMLNARHDDKQSDYFTIGDLKEFKNRGLNNSEVKENAVTFFVAGYDTTANTLAFACYCLATNHDVQDKCLEEIDNIFHGERPQFEDLSKLEYLDRFFNEVLRLYASAVRIQRGGKQNITVKGVYIPKDVDISVPLYALHRNPTYWPDPEKFDPDRFTEENKAKRPDFAFIPFGVGPRICIGMRLAVMEVKMALVFLLQNFSFSPCSKTEIPIELETGGLIRAKNGIPLKINNREKP
ncbi:cytochrome P450 3A41-like isoform X1 [Mytilus edulis]|uniref:cytochrome P450 3A41-like isoform X1 n=2 Tax=Mytilus edulis TaxID=6550 RepID=UPI0039EE4A9F